MPGNLILVRGGIEVQAPRGGQSDEEIERLADEVADALELALSAVRVSLSDRFPDLTFRNTD